jgi:hypothetical protein
MTPVALKKDHDVKGHRYLGDIPEGIGSRLDAARAALVNSKSKWAKRHWRYVVKHLSQQWTIVTTAENCDVMSKLSPQWSVDPGFYRLDV